jgi:ABC-type branched-subunit amino acid transport system ATPase component
VRKFPIEDLIGSNNAGASTLLMVVTGFIEIFAKPNHLSRKGVMQSSLHCLVEEDAIGA